MERIYGNRSARELDRAGGYFQRHMEHMTSENLSSKGDIALELAHRDMKIATLTAERDAMRVELEALREACRPVCEWWEAYKELSSRHGGQVADPVLSVVSKKDIRHVNPSQLEALAALVGEEEK